MRRLHRSDDAKLAQTRHVGGNAAGDTDRRINALNLNRAADPNRLLPRQGRITVDGDAGLHRQGCIGTDREFSRHHQAIHLQTAFDPNRNG